MFGCAQSANFIFDSTTKQQNKTTTSKKSSHNYNSHTFTICKWLFFFDIKLKTEQEKNDIKLVKMKILHYMTKKVSMLNLNIHSFILNGKNDDWKKIKLN